MLAPAAEVALAAKVKESTKYKRIGRLYPSQ
jgi:hypothetical protein